MNGKSIPAGAALRATAGENGGAIQVYESSRTIRYGLFNSTPVSSERRRSESVQTHRSRDLRPAEGDRFRSILSRSKAGKPCAIYILHDSFFTLAIARWGKNRQNDASKAAGLRWHPACTERPLYDFVESHVITEDADENPFSG